MIHTHTTHKRTRAHTHTHKHTHPHTYPRIHTQHTHTHTHTHNTYTFMHTNTHINAYTYIIIHSKKFKMGHNGTKSHNNSTMHCKYKTIFTFISLESLLIGTFLRVTSYWRVCLVFWQSIISLLVKAVYRINDTRLIHQFKGTVRKTHA